MSEILLVGLPDPEAGAIEILLARRWPSLRTTRLARSERPGIPEQDARAKRCCCCVLDLSSTGLRNRNEKTEAALMEFLAGRPGILLSRDADIDWLERPFANAAQQPIVVIKTPYSSATLLAAMAQVIDTEHLSKVSATSSNRKPPAPANGVLPATRATDTANRPAPGAKTPQGIGLLKGSMPLLLDVFPQLRTRQTILLATQILAADEAVLLHLNKDVMFVACVREGWLASGIRLPILMRMLSSSDSTLLNHIVVQPLSHAEAEVVVRERFGDLQHRMRHPLDTLAWELIAIRLQSLQLQPPQGDLRLRLKRLPNFTRLNTIGPLDTQLAAICARMPQTLTELVKKFPGQEQQIYRFAVLSLLTGTGEIVPHSSPTAPPLPKEQTARQRGFFKSLLDRLL